VGLSGDTEHSPWGVDSVGITSKAVGVRAVICGKKSLLPNFSCPPETISFPD